MGRAVKFVFETNCNDPPFTRERREEKRVYEFTSKWSIVTVGLKNEIDNLEVTN